MGGVGRQPERWSLHTWFEKRAASPWPVTHLSLESKGHCHGVEVWEALWDAVMVSGIDVLLGHVGQRLKPCECFKCPAGPSP